MKNTRKCPGVRTILCIADLPDGHTLSAAECVDGHFALYVDSDLAKARTWPIVRLDECIDNFIEQAWSLRHPEFRLATVRRPRILFVDDDHDTRVAMDRLLNSQGYEPHCAGNCADAKCLIDEAPIDLVIADYLLSDGDGLTVLHYAQKRYPVEGVLISGVDEDDLVTTAVAAHFAARLLKPIAFARVMMAIEELLDPSRRAARISASEQTARKSARLEAFRARIGTMPNADLGKIVAEMKRHGEDLREEIALVGETRNGR